MRYNKIFIAFLAVFTLFSCNRKVDFQHSTFVSLDLAKITVSEDCQTLKLPVHLFNPTGEDVQVTVSAVDVTAVAFDDYEIVKPSNGILTFSGDVDSLDIEIAVSDKYVGVLTKNKKFDIKISSADVSVGAYKQATVTIKDLDHPLNHVFGTYAGNLIFADETGSKVPTTLELSAPEDDDTYTKVLIEGLEPYLSSYAIETPLEGKFDLATNKLTIKKGQVPVEIDDYSCILVGTTDATDEIDIEFAFDGTKPSLSLLTIYGTKCTDSSADPEAIGKFLTIYLDGELLKK
jgi:hypothetical protein